MDELHEQTVNLLSFQQLPTGVFDSQVAFNMLDRYGRASAKPLEATERRIAAHLRKLLGVHAPMPAMTLVQAPVFHAHTFSIYIEMAAPMAIGDFARSLVGRACADCALAGRFAQQCERCGQRRDHGRRAA